MVLKAIVVDDCLKCVFAGNCKPWKELTAHNRFKMKAGVGVKGILKGCPLPDLDKATKPFEGL